MLSILAAGAFLGAMGWIALRRPFLVYILAFLLIAYTWRLISVAYVDVAGPLYAIELFRDIGGARAAPWLVLCYGLLLGAFVLVFRPSRLRALVAEAPPPAVLVARSGQAQLSTVALGLISLFLLLTFAQLLQSGVIPLFAGIERYIFTNQHGGTLHQLVVKYGIHLSFILGLFYWSGTLRQGRPDRRFLYLLFGLFFYLLLVGNRFSAFYSHTCFFAIPASAMAIRRWCARAYGAGASRESRLISPNTVKGLVLLGALVGLIVYAQFHSLVRTRGFAGDLLWENLSHRLFVIQGELWNTMHERVFLHGQYDPSYAFDRLFVHPVVPDRSSTLPFLMELEIGDQAYPILELGAIYTGGYPEVLFELVGPVLGFVAVALLAYLTARAMFALVRAILWQRYIRIVLTFYVAYAFVLCSVSGMLNIFSTWKFLVKLGALWCWILFEKGRDLRHRGDRETLPSATGMGQAFAGPAE